ncbi:MAG TPA: pilus assembly protein N-terminal domain-containing protein [Candidatus Krumholzibacteria bacterium]|nr:pilus assembly protein N-terminal domain-containing protein [Candidatus Krumholzibacteria bacterium]
MSWLSKSIKAISRLALAVALVAAPAAAQAATTKTQSNPQINVIVGQSVTHKLDTKVKTVSISDSDIADVVVAGPNEVLVNGKKIGLTTLVIWDDANNSRMFNVTVRGPFSDQKIELRVKLAEVNRQKALDLGFNFFGQTEQNGATYSGALAPVPIPTDQANALFSYIKGTDQITAAIKALETNGVLKILAEPTVIAASGEEAHFLSGGEIPVPVAVTPNGATGTTVTIEWKEFGTKVHFVPTIVDTGVINLVVSPEVSQLDYNNAVLLSGFRIPAIRVRKAETTVELSDQESLVIGGLIQTTETKIKKSIPILGHIPLLGYLFSDYQTQKDESELLIVVSPHLVRALAPGATVDLPGAGPQNMNVRPEDMHTDEKSDAKGK